MKLPSATWNPQPGLVERIEILRLEDNCYSYSTLLDAQPILQNTSVLSGGVQTAPGVEDRFPNARDFQVASEQGRFIVIVWTRIIRDRKVSNDFEFFQIFLFGA